MKEFKKEVEKNSVKQEREINQVKAENQRLQQELKRLETIFNNHSKGMAMIHENS